MRVGMMTMGSFPLGPLMALRLERVVDVLVLRFDLVNGGKLWYDSFVHLGLLTKPHVLLASDTGYGWSTNFEEMLRRVDYWKPDVVVSMDCDETYGDGFEEDLERFENSNDDLLLFSYDMVSDNGRKLPQNPWCVHCKAFKWYKGLTFDESKGFNKPAWNSFPHDQTSMMADSKMRHFCFFSPDLQDERMAQYLRKKGLITIKKMYEEAGLE